MVINQDYGIYKQIHYTKMVKVTLVNKDIWIKVILNMNIRMYKTEGDILFYLENIVIEGI